MSSTEKTAPCRQNGQQDEPGANTTTDRPAVTYCPRWCGDDSDQHAELHESRPVHVRLPHSNDMLFVSAVMSASDEMRRESVCLYDGDDPVLEGSASTMRSVAAALVHAADVAEGLR